MSIKVIEIGFNYYVSLLFGFFWGVGVGGGGYGMLITPEHQKFAWQS